MRTVFVLASVVGMLVGGTYAIRDAGMRGKTKVRLAEAMGSAPERAEGEYPEMPESMCWWEEGKASGSHQTGGDEGEKAVLGGGTATESGVAGGDGAASAVPGAVTSSAVAESGEFVVKPAPLTGETLTGISSLSEGEKARLRQIQKRLAKMRQQVRRQLEVTMRNARIPPDARQDIRMLAGQLFQRIADIQMRAAAGEVPRYQARQEMRAAWYDFTSYVNQRLDDRQKKVFWREWEYTKNPQKRVYDMQRQLQDVQKKVNQQNRRMERLMRRQPRRDRPKR